MRFSIVMPIRDEVQFLRYSLPSCLKVGADEIIIATDKPVPIGIKHVVASAHSFRVRILEVQRNPEYRFHQAWVRRSGFEAAGNDRILTVDSDCVINNNVLKAVGMVGQNNIGLASLVKHLNPLGLTRMWREFFYITRRRLISGTFTGLYAFYRPYWKDTETTEDLKILENPKLESLVDLGWGEDDYLRINMSKKYKVVFLKEAGCYSLDDQHGDLPRIQFQTGRELAKKGEFFEAFENSFLLAHPYVLKGYFA
jgi:glycosyltransferase involved in cell wall biosynthesis